MQKIIISVKSAGFGSSQMAQIYRQGKEVGFGTYGTGVNVAVFDEATAKVLATNSFDTTVKPNDDIFANYINGLPAGRIVAIAVQGNSIPTEGLSNVAQEAFKSIGSNWQGAVQPNYAWSLIGIKGEPGGAIESITWPIANVSYTVAVTDLGPEPGQPKKLQFKQVVRVRETAQEFGNSGVAIQEGVALVGASKADFLPVQKIQDVGCAYILNIDYDQWQPQQQLVPEKIAATENIGQSVAMSGKTAIIGASLADKETGYYTKDAGAAYIFELEGGKWVEKQKLQPLDLLQKDYFGHSVAVDGHLAIVGAYGASNVGLSNANNSGGAAYIFEGRGSGWKQIQLLQPSDLNSQDQFGFSVAISGNVAVVGAYMADAPNKVNVGAAYIFALEDGKWVQKQKLQPEELSASDYFGYSVAIDGNVILVGAYMSEEDGKTNTGAVYLFDLEDDEWVEKQKLKPREQLIANEYFGWSVSISGELAVVGAPQSRSMASLANAGAIYLFQKDDNGVWQPKQKEQPGSLRAQNKFGSNVNINGNLAIVGTNNAAIQPFVAIYNVVSEG